MVNQQLELPKLIEGVTLMSPGIWNGWEYASEELKKAFENTDWDNLSLFLDHPENPNNAASDWIGRVINPQILSDGTIIGDIEVWDEDTVFKLTVAKAKFGVSPRVLGRENKLRKSFEDFIIDNMSVVSKPAQNTSMINLASQINFNGLSIMQLSSKDAERTNVSLASQEMSKRVSDHGGRHLEIMKKITNGEEIIGKDRMFIASLISSEELSNNNYPRKESLAQGKIKLKGGIKEMAKEVKNLDEQPEEKVETKPEVKSEDAEKETSTEKASEELSDSEVLSLVNDHYEEFNAYASSIRAENPKIDLKSLAKGFIAHRKKMSIVEELSSAEQTLLLKKIIDNMGISELSNTPKIVEPVAQDSGIKELAAKFDDLKQIVSELHKSRTPAPKSVVGPQAGTETPHRLVKGDYSEGVQEMAALLGKFAR